MSATDILKLCDEVLAASKGITPLPWKESKPSNSEMQFVYDGNEKCVFISESRPNGNYLTIAANCAPALAEYVKRLHEAAAAAGVDLDRMTLRGHGTR